MESSLENIDANGVITHICGKKLEEPIPFKKGDNLLLLAKEYLPPSTEWSLVWEEHL